MDRTTERLLENLRRQAELSRLAAADAGHSRRLEAKLIEKLLDRGVSVHDIAAVSSFSRQTIYRRFIWRES